MKPTKAKRTGDRTIDAADANHVEVVQGSPIVPLFFCVILPMLLLILYGIFA
jgi:hypothetical protein